MTLHEELQQKTVEAITMKVNADEKHKALINDYFISLCNKTAESGELRALFFPSWVELADGKPVTSSDLESFAKQHNLDYTSPESNSPAYLSWK